MRDLVVDVDPVRDGAAMVVAHDEVLVEEPVRQLRRRGREADENVSKYSSTRRQRL
jgi:hypothetical protein